VEHACHRCGSAVNDSSPFCESCGAPQVRLAADESAAHNVKVAATVPYLTTATQIEPSLIPRARLDRNAAWRAAINSGVVSGLLSLLPLGLLLGAPLGGLLCVLLYRRRTPAGDGAPVSGFRLGIMSGVCGYALLVLLLGGQIALSHGDNEFRSGMVEAIHRQQARTPDPQARQKLDYFLTPPGMKVMIVSVLALGAVVFVLLSGVGGAVAAALLRRKQPPS
jgi:hypothetical protein